MVKTKVAIIFGGKSSEHEISIMSANSVMENIDKEKFEVLPIEISKSGEIDIEKVKKADVVFPILHGVGGEDGAIQGFCETLGKPYVGSGIEASALALDKIISKQIWRDLKLPIPSFSYFTKKEWEENQSKILRKISPPVFIKPAKTGSSIGISKFEADKKITSSKLREKLTNAIEEAFRYDDRVIIEKAIDAREIEVAVLGDKELTTSVPGEIVPASDFYSFEAKYKLPSELLIPAPISKNQVLTIQLLAEKAYRALGCRGLARVDFFLDKKTAKIYLNEINTIPGFTQISMYPKLLEVTGIPYKELITKLIELA